MDKLVEGKLTQEKVDVWLKEACLVLAISPGAFPEVHIDPCTWRNIGREVNDLKHNCVRQMASSWLTKLEFRHAERGDFYVIRVPGGWGFLLFLPFVATFAYNCYKRGLFGDNYWYTGSQFLQLCLKYPSLLESSTDLNLIPFIWIKLLRLFEKK